MTATLPHEGSYEVPHGPDGFVLSGCWVDYRAAVDGDASGLLVAVVTVRVTDGAVARWVDPPGWMRAGLLAYAQTQAETDPQLADDMREAIEGQAQDQYAASRAAAE
ncbi:MAG: hypothetical protein VR70_14450 [Rhodospirillaceae bacterium BRH_c57]|nr:MAG: hypothetical protein VR70_14450 [Rhodospirillaceae bacterium BRH_c57]